MTPSRVERNIIMSPKDRMLSPNNNNDLEEKRPSKDPANKVKKLHHQYY